jgi:hypothetical protein
MEMDGGVHWSDLARAKGKWWAAMNAGLISKQLVT